MKLLKWLGITLAAAVLVGGFLVVKARAAEAQQLRAALGAGAGGGRGQLLARVADRLDLTADQKARIKAELAGDKDVLSGLLAKLHEARIDLRATIQKPGATENEIRGAAAKVASAEADLAVERARLYGRISPILTAGQLAKLNQLQQRVDDLVDAAIAMFAQRLTQ
jgi:Spy/CpxP family protein refolding chaperone